MAIDYLGCLGRAEEVTNLFEQMVDHIYFAQGTVETCKYPNYWELPTYQQNFVPLKACVDMCRILRTEFYITPEAQILVYEYAADLDGHSMHSKLLEQRGYFKRAVELVRGGFRLKKDEISSFCSAFDEEEKQRVNEAIHSHLERCDFSCIAMSVSAVESRLLKLMCLAHPDSKPKFDKMTFGQLLQEYANDPRKYSDIVPAEHTHLLTLSNDYRIFSVHPKGRKITPQVATAIFNLSLEFLIDNQMRPDSVKTRLGQSKQ